MSAPLKEPSFSEGLIAGHGVGMEIARLEIRRVIAPALRELRIEELKHACKCKLDRELGILGPCATCRVGDALGVIDKATRPARAKKGSK